MVCVSATDALLRGVQHVNNTSASTYSVASGHSCSEAALTPVYVS